MNDERERGTCSMCKTEDQELCGDLVCRACHKSCSWEDCTRGTYNAANLRRLGYSDERILELHPQADLSRLGKVSP